MCKARWVVAATVVTFGLALADDAWADPEVSSSVPDSPPLRGVTPEPLELALRRRVEAARFEVLSGTKTTPMRAPSFAVVELPADQVPGVGTPGRRHHALSLRFRGAERAMRSWGVNTSECSAQVRMPAKLDQVQGTSSLNATAQVRLSCRM
jgi:hypothetical protein